MASAPRLPKHLRAALGEDAGAELVTIIDELRNERRHSEALHREQLVRFDQRFDHIDQRFEHIDQRFEHIDQRFDRVEDRMGAIERRVGSLEVKLGDVKADLMKWSFVFWVGAVGAIAALAGVLQ